MRDLVETNIIGAFNVLKAAAGEVRDNGAIIALTTSLVRHAVRVSVLMRPPSPP
jgi:3-oxoacyl-[acyl-carrier protein] reductase